MVARVIQAFILAFILGTMFWDLDVELYYNRLGLTFYSLTLVSFGSLAELPSILEQKYVLAKHNTSRMLRVSSFVLRSEILIPSVSKERTSSISSTPLEDFPFVGIAFVWDGSFEISLSVDL